MALHDGKTKSLSDVLHVPSITKNLVSVGQMVEQGLQVRFNAKGCFVEDFNDKCRLVAKESRIGCIFTGDALKDDDDYNSYVQIEKKES